MSDLQLVLLAVGLCVVAGVYAYNWWLERQFRRRTELAFEHEHEDILMPGEPVAAESTLEIRVEPRLDAVPAVPFAPVSAPRAHVARTRPAPLLDPVIDYVVEVELDAPTFGSELHEVLTRLASNWHKAILVTGYDAAAGEWQEAGGDAYRQLRFSVQMSNRAGCIEDAQLTAFRTAVADPGSGLSA